MPAKMPVMSQTFIVPKTSQSPSFMATNNDMINPKTNTQHTGVASVAQPSLNVHKINFTSNTSSANATSKKSV